jgi:hypothetical protein
MENELAQLKKRVMWLENRVHIEREKTRYRTFSCLNNDEYCLFLEIHENLKQVNYNLQTIIDILTREDLTNEL